MTPHPLPHPRVEALAGSTEVTLVTVLHLALLGQVHLIVVDRRRRRLHGPHQAVVHVRLHVELVAEPAPLPVGKPSAVTIIRVWAPSPPPPPPIFLFLFFWLVSSSDDAGILDDTLLRLVTHRVYLTLQLFLHLLVIAGFNKPLAEQPHPQVVWNDISRAKEPPERDPVRHLTFQLQVG